MLINFKRWLEIVFKSFDVSADTKAIERLKQDWIRFLMVIKRHWIYGILHSWRVLVVLILSFVNAYLLIFGENHNIFWSIIAWFLVINVIFWFYIILNYLYNFYKIYGSTPCIEDIESAIAKNKKSDIIFTGFFNQTVFLFFVMIIISIFIIINSVYTISWLKDAWFLSINLLNIVLILIQLGLFISYLKNMVNLEMDFNIVVPEKIYFYNQNFLLGSSQSMNAEKIKTMNTKYPWFIASFFNYWDIIIFTEWDNEANNWQMTMNYIGHPNKAIKEIQTVLDNNLEQIEKDVNVLLKKLENEIWIPNISTPENKEKLKKYVRENEKKLKELYDEADNETKSEIKELYVLINE